VPDHVWFAEPVDLERDGCPDYLEIIHHPLDLKIIQSRMTEGRYDTPESFYAKFVSDIRRIFDNATAYNYDADHATDLCQRSSG
jgi:transcription initiation factor TFIID subunit 2